MVNFNNFNINQQLIPFFVFFNAKNLCVSQNLLNTHHVANSRACDLFKNNLLLNMPLSFFAEKKTRFFLCVGVEIFSILCWAYYVTLPKSLSQTPFPFGTFPTRERKRKRSFWGLLRKCKRTPTVQNCRLLSPSL